MRKVTRNSGPSSRNPDAKMKPSFKRSARKSKKYSRRSNSSVGSRISNGEDVPGRHGNGAGPAKEDPVAEAPGTGDPTIGDPAEVLATDAQVEIFANEAPEEISTAEAMTSREPNPKIPTPLRRIAYPDRN